MRAVLLIDFGSTYTKLTAVDLDAEVVLGTAAAYTTVQTDINDGLNEGLQKLEANLQEMELRQTALEAELQKDETYADQIAACKEKLNKLDKKLGVDAK